MSKNVNDNLVLSMEESRNLRNSLLMPREEVLVRRNAFFESIDEMVVEKNIDGTIFIEIPDLIIDDSSYKNNLLHTMNESNYCFSEEAFIEVNYCDKKKVQIRRDCVLYSARSAAVDIYYDAKDVNVAEVA